MSLRRQYGVGTAWVCKYCVIAGLLLRNWCVFDSGNLLVVRGSFTAFAHPVMNLRVESYALSHRTFSGIKIGKNIRTRFVGLKRFIGILIC